MNNPRIKDYYNEDQLRDYGYTYSIVEGGYISADRATIVIIRRSPYERMVMQYSPNMENEHMRNLKYLKEIGAI